MKEIMGAYGVHDTSCIKYLHGLELTAAKPYTFWSVFFYSDCNETISVAYCSEDPCLHATPTAANSIPAPYFSVKGEITLPLVPNRIQFSSTSPHFMEAAALQQLVADLLNSQRETAGVAKSAQKAEARAAG
jgi:hypothetical protein